MFFSLGRCLYITQAAMAHHLNKKLAHVTYTKCFISTEIL